MSNKFKCTEAGQKEASHLSTPLPPIQYKAILIWCFILTIEKVTEKVKTPKTMQSLQDICEEKGTK